jgi:regulator of protease activity HflC (stomatin/prohibitin superfamily)
MDEDLWQVLSPASLMRSLMRSKWLLALGVVFVAVEVYDLGLLPAYVNAKKARETGAIALNAGVKQEGEAVLAEQKAIVETEVAAHAARRQAAEARKAKAEALKTDAEARTARAMARNAELRARAEADRAMAEAAINSQKLVIETELARQAARRQEAETREAEIGVAVRLASNLALSGRLPTCLFCPGRGF